MAETMPIERSILADFECPICTNYMFPPIRQCVNGHSYCPSCFQRIKRCSQCRGGKCNARCYVLEKIHSKLTFPCKYQIDGCVVGAKGMLIKRHEEFCEYTKKLCPLRTIDFCSWHGTQKDIVRHARDMHPGYIFLDYKQKLVVPEFTLYTPRQHCSMFSVFNELFRLTWDLNDETGSMRFAVYSINRPLQEKYSYQVSFLRGNSDREVISLKGPCGYCDTDYGRFVASNYLVTNYDMLRELCDADGNLHYIVKIFDNDVFKQFLHEYFIKEAAVVELDAAAGGVTKRNGELQEQTLEPEHGIDDEETDFYGDFYRLFSLQSISLETFKRMQ